MTEPFTTPPPLGDDIEARTHQLARRLRGRRRAGVVGSAALVLLLLGGAAAAAVGGNHGGAKVRVAGHPEATSVTSTRSATSIPGMTTTKRHRAILPSTTTTRRGAPDGSAPRSSHTGTDRNGGGSAVSSTSDSKPGTSTGPARTTLPPGSVTTTSVWNPTNVCVSEPQGTTVTLTPTIRAQQVAAGKWHLSGTMTIVNASPYAYYTTGYLYISGTTVPGGTGEGWVGWTGTATVMVGSGASMGGMVLVPAGQTITVALDQTLHTDGAANADAPGTTPPTTIHQGKDFGTFERWVSGCSNVPTVVDNFPIGGPPPT